MEKVSRFDRKRSGGCTLSRGFSAKYSVMYSKVYNRQKADSLPPVVLRYNRVDQFLLNVVVASHEFIACPDFFHRKPWLNFFDRCTNRRFIFLPFVLPVSPLNKQYSGK